MRKYMHLSIGIIIGIMIAIPAFSMAESIGQKVEASFNKFNFYVNGQVQELEADPLVYQGSTYLPVRVVSNMLGFDVTYKADGRKIELNSLIVTDENAPVVSAPKTPQEQIGKESERNLNSNVLNEYISLRDISNDSRFNSYGFYFKDDKYQLVRYQDQSKDDSTREVIIENVPYTISEHMTYISLEFYNNSILPILDN